MSRSRSDATKDQKKSDTEQTHKKNRINWNVKCEQIIAREKKPQTSKLTNFSTDIYGLISSFQTGKDNANLSASSASLFSGLASKRIEFTLRDLLQSIIDGHRNLVRKILEVRPELLLMDPAKNRITVVESQKTWQKFKAEKPFIMALKRGQFEMAKLILFYLNKLLQVQNSKDDTKEEKHREKNSIVAEIKDVKAELTKQLELPKMVAENKKVLEEKLQQKYLKVHLEPLIEILKKEKCLNGYEDELSKESENALEDFRKKVLNDNIVELVFLSEAINKDNYFDVIQLLIAAYDAFRNKFEEFQSDEQRYVYYIRVIGFLLSLVYSELGEVYCESLDKVVEDGKQIGEQAKQLIMQDGEDFYRESRTSRDGQGFDFACDFDGSGGAGVRCDEICPFWDSESNLLEKYVEQTYQNLINLFHEVIAPQKTVESHSLRLL